MNLHIPDYGTLMTLDEFGDAIRHGYINNDDGSGFFATEKEYSEINVFSDIGLIVDPPSWATHVMWFEK
jgi:hypothetical protein